MIWIFADDIALLSHTPYQMQRKTDGLSRISRSVGLSNHAGKSKVPESERASEDPITVQNTPLVEVESFTYLGSIIDKKGGTEADVNVRISKARTAFTQLQKI